MKNTWKGYKGDMKFNQVQCEYHWKYTIRSTIFYYLFRINPNNVPLRTMAFNQLKNLSAGIYLFSKVGSEYKEKAYELFKALDSGNMENIKKIYKKYFYLK